MSPAPTGIPELAARLMSRYRGERLLVGIAGPPGSGKSTLADALSEEINAGHPALSAVMPMDGFHYDDSLLKEMGRLAHKGAPDTFDVGGLHHLLRRLRDNTETAIAVPVFDRSIEIARAGARLIPHDTGIIIVEGNYVLLDHAPWRGLKSMFDITVLVETSLDTLRERLTARWLGFDLPPEEIRRKVEANDLPNGMLILKDSASPDIRITN